MRHDLPDAVFGTWRSIVGTVKRARAAARRAPARVTGPPTRALAGCSGTPLPKKLGVMSGGLIRLLDAPKGLESVLRELPDGARVTSKRELNMTLWFVSTAAALENDLARAAGLAADGFLWICWPKKASGVPSEVGDREVRAAGLAVGLVDSKVAAIDADVVGVTIHVAAVISARSSPRRIS